MYSATTTSPELPDTSMYFRSSVSSIPPGRAKCPKWPPSPHGSIYMSSVLPGSGLALSTMVYIPSPLPLPQGLWRSESYSVKKRNRLQRETWQLSICPALRSHQKAVRKSQFNLLRSIFSTACFILLSSYWYKNKSIKNNNIYWDLETIIGISLVFLGKGRSNILFYQPWVKPLMYIYKKIV